MEKIKEPLKLGAILGGIALIIAVMLSLVNGITAERIEKVNAQIVQDGLKKAMPSERNLEFILMEGEVDYKNDYNVKVSSLYIAMDEEGNIAGYCATVLPQGYGGTVETIVGVDLSGTITGVVVTSNMSETPGLGAKVTNNDAFTYQFENKTPGTGFALKRDGGDIDAITSATVTSRAVTNGINAAVEVIEKNSAYEDDKVDIIDGKYIVKAETPEEPEEGEEGENSEEGEEAEENE